MNRTSLRLRLASLAAAGAVVAGLTTAIATHTAAVAAAGPVAPADDFATTAWGDPWDFSNSSDILRDNKGPMNGISGSSIGSGLLSFTVASRAYISPLFTGYPGSVYQGRDGGLNVNAVNAGHYTHLSFQMYASNSTSGGVFWFTCAGQVSTCMGGMPFSVLSGWHTYSMTLRNDSRFGLPRPWGGTVRGLRLALNGRPTAYKIDWIRLWAPSSALQTGVRGVPWASTTPDPSYPGRTQGVLVDGDASALPPGSYTVGGSPLTIAAPPMPVVLHPDASGGSTWLQGLCYRWPFNSGTSILKTVDVGSGSWSGGALNARNAPPVINDPQVWLRMPSGGINPRSYHRMSVTFRNDRAFDLSNTATGGTMGRVVWYDSAHGFGRPIQTADWVEYNDRPTMVLDLAGGTSVLETDAGNRYPWGSYPVVGMRWDPDEATGPVSWHLYDATLCADDYTTTAHTYNITWRQSAPGDVTLTWDADNVPGGRTVIVTLPHASAGTHSYTWNASSMVGKRVWISIGISNGVTSGTAYSSGPLHVR